MTVEVETARVSYTGSGTTGPFTIPFYFLSNSDIKVIKVTIADGTETALALTTDYTLTGAGDEAGGTLTLVSSLSSSFKLVIYRDPELLQEVDYPRNDPFPAKTHEQVADRLTMIAQRLKDLFSRMLRLTDGDTTGLDLELPAATAADRAGAVIGFDANGTALQLYDPSSAVTAASNVNYTPSGSEAIDRTVEKKLQDEVSVKDFGAVLDNSTDDASAFTKAMAAHSRVRVPYTSTGAKLASGIEVPAGVELIMDHGMVLKPSADMTYVVKVHAGGKFVGKIDCTDISFTGAAIDFDGDDNADSVPFRLSTKSEVDAILIGDDGGTGTACKLHADNAANARVMGVKGRIKVRGFEYGYWLRQTSTDGTKFVTGNDLEIVSALTLRPLYMDSAQDGRFIEGNRIYVEVQPETDTTVPAVTIDGQNNIIIHRLWDWATVEGTAPKAISIVASSRWNTIIGGLDPDHIENNSTDDDNVIINPVDDGGVKLGSLRALGTNLKLLETNLRFDNNQILQWLDAAGGTRSVLRMTSADEVLLQGSPTAGTHLALSSGNATGQVQMRINGVTKAGCLDNGNLFWRSATAQNGQLQHANTASRIYSFPDWAGNVQVPRVVAVAGTARSVTTAESGTVFTNEGATASQEFILPAAAAGAGPFTFVVQDGDGIKVTAGSGDTIRVDASVSAAAGNIASTTIGDSVTLLAINATEWVAVASIHPDGWAVT